MGLMTNVNALNTGMTANAVQKAQREAAEHAEYQKRVLVALVMEQRETNRLLRLLVGPAAGADPVMDDLAPPSDEDENPHESARQRRRRKRGTTEGA